MITPMSFSCPPITPVGGKRRGQAFPPVPLCHSHQSPFAIPTSPPIVIPTSSPFAIPAGPPFVIPAGPSPVIPAGF